MAQIKHFSNTSGYNDAEETLRSCIKLYAVMDSFSIDEILHFTLEEAARLTGSPIGYFHFVNPDQKTIRLQAWSKETLKYCTAAEKETHYPIEKAGVWVDCIHQKKPVIHNDYKILRHKKGLPDGHVAIERDLGVPVFNKDKIIAVLGVGNKPVPYTQRDTDKISLLAESAATIIQRKRAEEDREKVVRELQEALVQVKTLSGLLPICSSCKKIRDDTGYWNQIETYLHKHSEAEFTHSICPDCIKKLYPDFNKD
jgi:hypothetical protein